MVGLKARKNGNGDSGRWVTIQFDTHKEGDKEGGAVLVKAKALFKSQGIDIKAFVVDSLVEAMGSIEDGTAEIEES